MVAVHCDFDYEATLQLCRSFVGYSQYRRYVEFHVCSSFGLGHDFDMVG